MSKSQNQITIIGAGPAGSCAALFLAKKGVPVTLLDKAVFPRDKVCGDALSGKVVQQLMHIGPELFDEFTRSDFLLPSWGVTFGSPRSDEIDIPFVKENEKPESPPGYIARRIDFDNYLVEKCRENDLIDLHEGCWITSYEKKEDYWEVHEKKGQVYKSKLLLIADGAHSSFAKKIASLEVKEKHLAIGLRAYVKGVKNFRDDHYIQLLFLKELLPGYFWLFPLNEGYANVGLGLRSDLVKSRGEKLNKLFYDLFQNHPNIKDRLEHAEIEGPVKLFPLPLGSVRRSICGDGYMLLGDAGALIDPFTGEGIGNAMISAEIAAEQAFKCVEEEEYSAAYIDDYEKQVYNKLGKELNLSYRMQQLSNYPWLFNFMVGKAKRSKKIQETISCMFDNLDVRSDLKNPLFYLNLLFKK